MSEGEDIPRVMQGSAFDLSRTPVNRDEYMHNLFLLSRFFDVTFGIVQAAQQRLSPNQARRVDKVREAKVLDRLNMAPKTFREYESNMRALLGATNEVLKVIEQAINNERLNGEEMHAFRSAKDFIDYGLWKVTVERRRELEKEIKRYNPMHNERNSK